MNKNIMTFDEWAIMNKDEGMEKGHHASVEHMFQLLNKTFKEKYSVIDFGCGNGWVVRKFKKHSLCKMAHGLDGASAMIKKAMKADPNGMYFNEDINTWTPQQKYDIVFSMETLYYFENPGNQLYIVEHFDMYQDALTAKKDRKIQDEYFILYKDQNNEFCAR